MQRPAWTLVFSLALLLCLSVNENEACSSSIANRQHLAEPDVCAECPPHYCNDDPAIIQGYCCGCGQNGLSLPIKCHPRMSCPIDRLAICRDFDYMMKCCC